MSMSDPIADMLTRVRNAVQAGHVSVQVPSSSIKEEICAVLKREGFIREYKVEDDGKQGLLLITLKYASGGDCVLQGIKRVSKPSLRVYAGASEIKNIRSGLGISILSTSRGVMTGKEARAAKVGGEVLCEVW